MDSVLSVWNEDFTWDGEKFVKTLREKLHTPTTQERRIDRYWNIDGSRDLSDSWTGFTQFTLISEKLEKDIYGPVREWQNGKRHPGQIIYWPDQKNQLKTLPTQVNKDEYSRDKKFSPKITSPAPELTNIGLHLQVPRGGTHLNGAESELTIFIFAQISFCYSWFCSQLIALTGTDGGVDRTPSHQTFSRTLSSLCTHHIVAQGVAACVWQKNHSRTCHYMSERLLFPCFGFFLCLSCLCVLSLSLTSTCSLFWTSTPIMSRTPSIKPKAHPHNEEYCPVATYTTLSHIKSDVARGSSGEGSVRRQKERRLRSWLRHGILAIRLAVTKRRTTPQRDRGLPQPRATPHKDRRKAIWMWPKPCSRSGFRNRWRSSMKPWIMSTSPCLR